jgi:hypothetical protein
VASFLDDAKAALEEKVRDVKEAIGLPTDRSTKHRLSVADGVARTKAEQDALAGIQRRD